MWSPQPRGAEEQGLPPRIGPPLIGLLPAGRAAGSPAGRAVYGRAAADRAAHAVDAELLRDLGPRLQEALRAALTQLGSGQGLDYT